VLSRIAESTGEWKSDLLVHILAHTDHRMTWGATFFNYLNLELRQARLKAFSKPP
jgi:hypothetical protein